MGKLVLSPTRTYAPVLSKFLDNGREGIYGLIHCSGGAQTKVGKFLKNGHIVKGQPLCYSTLVRFDSE